MYHNSVRHSGSKVAPAGKASACAAILTSPERLCWVQLNGLMGHFQQQTGSQFTGHSSQVDMIAKMASEKLGIPIPASIIEKL